MSSLTKQVSIQLWFEQQQDKMWSNIRSLRMGWITIALKAIIGMFPDVFCKQQSPLLTPLENLFWDLTKVHFTRSSEAMLVSIYAVAASIQWNSTANNLAGTAKSKMIKYQKVANQKQNMAANEQVRKWEMMESRLNGGAIQIHSSPNTRLHCLMSPTMEQWSSGPTTNKMYLVAPNVSGGSRYIWWRENQSNPWHPPWFHCSNLLKTRPLQLCKLAY